MDVLLDAIDKYGIITFPVNTEKTAAPSEDTYAITNATANIFDALFPSLGIEGAIKPITIKGTQKFIY